MKEQYNTKGIVRKLWEKNKDNAHEIEKKPLKYKLINEKIREINQENDILSRKLVEIIRKKKEKSCEKASYFIKKEPSFQKNKEIQAENSRIYNNLHSIKPLIDTKELRKEWKNTKKYKRNLRSFNKFNQPKHELNFINSNCNKNINNYLKEQYLLDKTNVFNIKAPNYVKKKPFVMTFERIFHKINVDNKNLRISSNSCEMCRKNNDERIRNSNYCAKLLLDSSMIV